ncbi:hypothetical protein [Aureimonas glaciei]|uniref:hypothetical protein n=1 Tax=Aureimonas glaciei TaxID=1776957 RepID=UPI00166ADC5E|nr:hypothetical protein [Aureimonas glaciei]
MDTIGAKVGPMMSPDPNVFIEVDADGRSWDEEGRGYGRASGFDLVAEWTLPVASKSEASE